jgi:hypothetical protein
MRCLRAGGHSSPCLEGQGPPGRTNGEEVDCETSTFSWIIASLVYQSMMGNQSMMGKGQNFEFACHLPGHYEAGMRLPIIINK